MDCTKYFAYMSDTPEIQDLAFDGKRHLINGHDASQMVRFHNGDLVYERETRKVIIIYHDTQYKRYIDRDSNGGNYGIETVTNAKEEWSRESIVWLPRCADLQAIYHLSLPKGYSHYQVIFDFCAWLHKNDYLYITSHVTKGFSMEKLWLIFIMDKMHNKRFDASALTWEDKFKE